MIGRWIRIAIVGGSLLMSCSQSDVLNEKKGSSLRICFKREPVSLDPRKGNDMVSSQVHFMLFEGLLCLNPDLSLSLGQAESYELSSDRKVYTFYLKDTCWSDGSPVTSFDFAYSWKSILDSEFPSRDAHLLYAIKNARQAKAGKIPLDQVGIYCKDAKTLIVELESPNPCFLQIVASSVLLPIHSQQVRSDPNWEAHVESFYCNGPFKLQQYDLNQQIILQKNLVYQKRDQIQLDHIIIDILDNEMAVLCLYATGEYDLVGSPLSFFPHCLREDLEKKKLLTFFPVANTKFLAFNTTQGPFDNVNIRRAFAYAISRKNLVDHIAQLNEKEALNIIPPILLKDLEYFSDEDLIRAQECFRKGLKEINADQLTSIKFMYVSTETNHILAQELQQVWSRILGVQVILENVEFQTLHQRSAQGDFSIGMFAWVADYADPMSILDRFTDKTNHRNYPKWENLVYNQLLKSALENSSYQGYIENIQAAEQLLINEMPLTCLFHENYAFLSHPHVKNLTISPLGHIYFDRIVISR